MIKDRSYIAQKPGEQLVESEITKSEKEWLMPV
jgi:hypothetical protein